jgi:hypothetical protein
MARQRVDCVIVLGEPMFFAERRRISALAIEARLPTMFVGREHVEAGDLMSYGSNLREFSARCRLRGQNLERSQARRSASGTTDQIRTRNQPQDRKGDRPDDPGSIPAARR